jgi:hypothetical protein
MLKKSRNVCYFTFALLECHELELSVQINYSSTLILGDMLPIPTTDHWVNETYLFVPIVFPNFMSKRSPGLLIQIHLTLPQYPAFHSQERRVTDSVESSALPSLLSKDFCLPYWHYEEGYSSDPLRSNSISHLTLLHVKYPIILP